VVMPGTMNGVQLVSEMARRRPGLKVLFTSGYSENALIHNDRIDSDILLLSKPYRRADLARMVRRALASDADRQTPADLPFTTDATKAATHSGQV
jgi:DNA-binding LytR/AlgR family response regulator